MSLRNHECACFRCAETELAGAFPLHVVTAWLGNTPKVADKHYLQVTPKHYAQAVAQGGANGGAAGGRTRSQAIAPNQKSPRT